MHLPVHLSFTQVQLQSYTAPLPQYTRQPLLSHYTCEPQCHTMHLQVQESPTTHTLLQHHFLHQVHHQLHQAFSSQLHTQ